MRNSDLFRGNNKALISSINALLELDAKGSLAPHGIGEMARDLLETCAARLPAEQHQGDPVCWVNDQQLLLCSKSPRVVEPDNPMMHNLPRNIAGSSLQSEYCNTPLFRSADTAEVVALRGAYLRAGDREHELRAQLAEHNALLRKVRDSFGPSWHQMVFARGIDAALSTSVEPSRETMGAADFVARYCRESGIPEAEFYQSQVPMPDAKSPYGWAAVSNNPASIKAHVNIHMASAEPSVPKCEACKGNGVIGWRRGQTAESYEEGESPCEDCKATGYAHSNGMPVSGACTTCNGLGTVPDGEITGLDGVEFENGPVECVKDCPDCGSAPDALTDLATWKRRAIEAESKLRTYDPQVVELGEQAMQALLAEPKPNELVLTKCRLCDQLQTDLTERDQRIDQFEQVMQKVATLRGTLEQHGFREEVEALLWPGLHSRPEERGTPATEPCSGCGTPGWTGACNKCVPY